MSLKGKILRTRRKVDCPERSSLLLSSPLPHPTPFFDIITHLRSSIPYGVGPRASCRDHPTDTSSRSRIELFAREREGQHASLPPVNDNRYQDSPATSNRRDSMLRSRREARRKEEGDSQGRTKEFPPPSNERSNLPTQLQPGKQRPHPLR